MADNYEEIKNEGEVKDTSSSNATLTAWQQKMANFYAKQAQDVKRSGEPKYGPTASDNSQTMQDFTKGLEEQTMDAAFQPTEEAEGTGTARILGAMAGQKYTFDKQSEAWHQDMADKGLYKEGLDKFREEVKTPEGYERIKGSYDNYWKDVEAKQEQMLKGVFDEMSGNGWYNGTFDDFKVYQQSNPEEFKKDVDAYAAQQKTAQAELVAKQRELMGLKQQSQDPAMKAGTHHDLVEDGKWQGTATKVNDDPNDNTFVLDQDTIFTMTGDGYRGTKAGDKVLRKKGEQVVLPRRESAESGIERRVTQAKAKIDAAMASGGEAEAKKVIEQNLLGGKNALVVSDVKFKPKGSNTETSEKEEVLKYAWASYQSEKINDAAQSSLDYIDEVLSKPENMTAAEQLFSNKVGHNSPVQMFGKKENAEPTDKEHLYSNIIDEATKRFTEGLKDKNLSAEDVKSMTEDFRTQAAKHIAQYNTNAAIADRVIGKGKWESVDADMKNMLTTIMDIGGGVGESLTGRFFMPKQKMDNVGTMINQLTAMMDTENRADITTITRGVASFVPDLWMYGIAGKMGGKVFEAFANRIIPATGQKTIMRLVGQGMSKADAAEVYTRAVLQQMSGKAKWGFETARELTTGSITFSTMDAINGMIDESNMRYVTADEDRLGRAIFNIAETGGSTEDLWHLKQNGADPSTVERMSRIFYKGLDGGKWGAISGGLFLGGPMTSWMGRGNGMVARWFGGRAAKVGADLSRLAINAGSMTYTQALEAVSEKSDGIIDTMKKAWGEVNMKSYITSAINLGMLDAMGVIKRAAKYEEIRDAERQQEHSAERDYYLQKLGIPESPLELLKQIADGKVAIPQGEGKGKHSVQLFEQKIGEDGKPLPLTEEQQKINEQLSSFFNNESIPLYIRMPYAQTLTGEPWKMPVVTSTGEVREEITGDRFAVDMLDDAGNVIDTHFYSSRGKAEEGRTNLDIAIGVGDLSAVSSKYVNLVAQSTFDDAVQTEYEGMAKDIAQYNKVVEKMQKVGKKKLNARERGIIDGFTQHQKDVVLCSENAELMESVSKKMKAGEELTAKEKMVADAVNRLYLDHLEKSTALDDIIEVYENTTGLEKGTINGIKDGYETKKEAIEADKSHSGIVKIGDRWFTTKDIRTLRDFRQALSNGLKMNDEAQRVQGERLADEALKAAEQQKTATEEPEQTATEKAQAEASSNFATFLNGVYEQGKALQGKDRTKANKEYQRLEKELKAAGVDTDAIESMLMNGQYEELSKAMSAITDSKVRDKVASFVNAAETTRGMMSVIEEQRKAEVKAAHDEIDNQSAEDGTVSTITLENGNVVYLKKGNVRVNEDGSVNKADSDKMLVALDPKTGKAIAIDPADIKSVEVRNADELKAEAEQMVTDAVKEQHRAELEGTLAFQDGDVYDIAVDGEKKVGRVLKNNGDGTVVMDIDGKQTTMRVEDVQKMADDLYDAEAAKADAARAKAPKAEPAPQPTAQPVEQQTATEAPKAEPTEAPKEEAQTGFREEDLDKVRLSKKMTDIINNAAKNLGVSIEFFDGPRGMNGYVEGKKVYVNTNSPKSHTLIFGHELLHHMEGADPEIYNAFKEMAFQWHVGQWGESAVAKEITKGVERYKQQIYDDTYTKAWNEGREEAECQKLAEEARDAFGEEQYKQEIAADVAGQLISGEKAAEEIFKVREENNDPNWLESISKMKDFIMAYVKKIAEKLGFTTGEGVDIKKLQKQMGELYRDAVMKNRGNMLQAGEKRFSIDTQAQAVGLRFEKTEDGKSHFYVDLGNGKRGREITTFHPAHIKNSPMGAVLKQALKDGKISEEQYRATLANQCAMLQVFHDTPNLDQTFAISGAIAANQLKPGESTFDYGGKNRDAYYIDEQGNIAFQPYKSNSETQYNTTWDVTTICRKTQSAIDAMSATMLKLKRGLTPDEVIDIVYKNIYEVSEGEIPVPCNVCYVFNRWVNLGTLFETMRTLRDQFPESMSREEIADARIKAVDEMIEKVNVKFNKKQMTSYKSKLNELKKAEKEGDEEKIAKIKADIEAQEYSNKVAQIAKKQQQRLEDLNWKQFNYTHKAKKGARALTDAEQAEREQIMHDLPFFDKVTWFDYVRMQDDYKAIPDEVLFDINASTDFKNEYAGAWKYRTTRGSGMGKAAAAYAPEYFGTTIVGRATKPQDATDLSKNLFLARNEDGSYKYIDVVKTENTEEWNLKPEAVVLMRKAQDAAAAQNFYNGMRLQSTSDARPEYITDYNLHFVEQMCIGSKEQGFTKVPEMAGLIADVGTGINFSLIAKGKGYEELTRIEYDNLDAEDKRDCVELDGKIYHALYSDASGINHKDAMALNDAYDNAQNIMVCLSPLHGRIMCALAAKGRITFNIPWHSSGDTDRRFEAKSLAIGEIINMKDRLDATDYQNDKDKVNMTAEEKLARETMVAIKTGEELSADMKNLLLNAKKQGEDSKYNLLRQMYMRFRGEDIDGKPAKIQNKYLHPEDRDTAGEGYGSIDRQCRIQEWDEKTGEYKYDENGNPVYKQIKYSSAMAGLLMPNDYWDNLTTLETADRNGDAFVQYADSLGYIPRFTGWAKGKKYNANGWDLYQGGKGKGYWTTLIDTAMYGRDGERYYQRPVDASGIGERHVKPFAVRDENGNFNPVDMKVTLDKDGVQRELTPMKGNPNLDTPIMQEIVNKSVADVEARRAEDEKAFVELVKERNKKNLKGKFPWKNVAPWIQQEWMTNPEFAERIGKETGVKPEDIDPDDPDGPNGGGGIKPSGKKYSIEVTGHDGKKHTFNSAEVWRNMLEGKEDPMAAHNQRGLQEALRIAAFNTLGYRRFPIGGEMAKNGRLNPWDEVSGIVKWAGENTDMPKDMAEEMTTALATNDGTLDLLSKKQISTLMEYLPEKMQNNLREAYADWLMIPKIDAEVQRFVDMDNGKVAEAFFENYDRIRAEEVQKPKEEQMDKDDVVAAAMKAALPEGGKKYSLMGEMGAANLDKIDGGTRMQDLNVAKEMWNKMYKSKKGVSYDDQVKIKVATGWEMGADGNWRLETMRDGKIKTGVKMEDIKTLGDIWDDPELYKAYPTLKDVKIEFDESDEYGGYYSDRNQVIDIANVTPWEKLGNLTDKEIGELNEINDRQIAVKSQMHDLRERGEEETEEFKTLQQQLDGINAEYDKYIGIPQKRAYKVFPSVGRNHDILLHEIQHFIQAREGFADGGSKKTKLTLGEEFLEGGEPTEIGFDNYFRLSGETEARNVEKRAKMSPDDRKWLLASDTEGVPRDEQIYVDRYKKPMANGHKADQLREARSYLDFFKGQDMVFLIREANKYGEHIWDTWLSPEAKEALLSIVKGRRKMTYEEAAEKLKEMRKELENTAMLAGKDTPKELSKPKYSLDGNEESAIYIPDSKEGIDFIGAILDGKKKGETRNHNRLTKNKWVGMAKDGKVYGRVKLGEPIRITKDSPEYKDAMIEGTEYDINDGESKYYYPIIEKQDFRDEPKDIIRNGNYGVYNNEGKKYSLDVEDKDEYMAARHNSFIDNSTVVKHDGTTRLRASFREEYPNMTPEEAWEKSGKAEAEKSFQNLMDKKEFVSFLNEKVKEGVATKVQSKKSESQYITYKGYKFRVSDHNYPTGSMTDLNALTPTIDLMDNNAMELVKSTGAWESNPDIRYSLDFDVPTEKVGSRMRKQQGESDAEFESRKQKYMAGVVESSEEARKRTLDQIQAYIDNKQIGQMGKRDLKELQTAVKDATPENLAEELQKAQHTINKLQSKVTENKIGRLLRFKVGDTNSRKMSIAKNVDEGTARVVKMVRSMMGSLATGSEADRKAIGRQINALENEITNLENEIESGNKTEQELEKLQKKLTAANEELVFLSGIDGERKILNKEHAKLNKEIESLTQSIKDNVLVGEDLDAAKARLEQAKLELDRNNEERANLQEEMNDIRDNNRNVTEKEVTDMLESLHEKQAKAALGEAEWTEADADQLLGYDIMQHRMAMLNALSEKNVRDTNRALAETELAALYKKGASEGDINAKKRDIIACEKMADQAVQESNRRGEEVVTLLTELLTNGKERLQNRLAEEADRKSRLILGVWGDIGKTTNEQRKLISQYDLKKKESASNGKLGNAKGFFNGVFGSFEYLAQHIAEHSSGRDSFFYKYFMEGPEGVMAAHNAALEGTRKSMQILNDKCEEIFGKDYLDVMKENEKVVDGKVTRHRTVGGMDIDHYEPLSKGSATYLYMVWKMPDGKVKLEHQGFDEVSMEEIKEFIGEKNIQFADWVQSEFLVQLREKYNETYRSLFNTSMADIKDYVPLKISSAERHQDVDVAAMNAPDTLSNKEGALMNRTFNLNDVDYTNSAYSVVAEHIQNMEEWNAFARVRQDLNYVLSSTAIRNQLNLTESGMFDRLFKAAQIATRTYKPNVPDASQWMGAATKGLAGANILLRNTTALKQTLSLPAFLGYSQDPEFMAMLAMNALGQYGRNSLMFIANIPSMGWFARNGLRSLSMDANPSKLAKYGMSSSLRWCVENIPSFRDRIAKGGTGNVVLDEMLGNEETWHSTFMQKVGQFGMSGNALVDAATCAAGLKTIYDYRYTQLLKETDKLFKSGAIKPEEYEAAVAEAHRQALVEAEIFVNGTQQSNHPAFLAPIQQDGDFASKMFTLYKNSPISYARKAVLSAQDLWRLRHYGELKQAAYEEFKKKGFDDDAAEAMAGRHMMKTTLKNVVGLALFGYGMNWLWNWGGQGILGFLQSDDDEEKSEVRKMAEMAAPVLNGVPGVDILMTMFQEQSYNPALLFDLEDNFKNDAKRYGWFSPTVGWDAMNTITRVGVGIDLNTLTNAYLGTEHLIKEGVTAENRARLLDYMFIMSTPNSNRKKVARKVYMDDDIDTFMENVMRADKLCDNDDWHRYLPGMRVIKEDQKQKILKEYAEAHATEFQKKMRDEQKANKVSELIKTYGNREAIREAYDKETDLTKKLALGKAYVKLLEQGDKTELSTKEQYQEVFNKMFPTAEDMDKELGEKEWVKNADISELASIHAIKQNIAQYDEIDKALTAFRAKGDADGLQKYIAEHEAEVSQMNKMKGYLSRISRCKNNLPKQKNKEDYDKVLAALRLNIANALKDMQ